MFIVKVEGLVLTGNLAANSDGTCYFSAPLYRKNLHYKVLTKPSSAGAAIKMMTQYILQNHQGDSGIVYCLSKKVRGYSSLNMASVVICFKKYFATGCRDRGARAERREWRSHSHRRVPCRCT